MTTEWGVLSGLYPIDSMLHAWMRAKATTSALFDAKDSAQYRFSHARIDQLIQNQLIADKGATYAKSFYPNLPTPPPYVSGPNSVKVATPLKTLEAQDIKINKAYLVSWTNSRASDLAAAAKAFKHAAQDGRVPRVWISTSRRPPYRN
jgi:homoaconitate hydratase